jgi:hypothetical protein
MPGTSPGSPPATRSPYDGTAPIEVSSGSRVVHRLSQRGSRRLNHAIRMVAVTQIRHQGTDGRRYYDKKISEGQDSPPRPQTADQQRHLRPPAARRPQGRRRSGRGSRRHRQGSGRATGERLCIQRGQLTPRTPALRTSHSRTRHHHTARHHSRHACTVEAEYEENPASPLTTTAKRTRSGATPGVLPG